MRKLRNRILQRRPFIEYRGFDSPLDYYLHHPKLWNLGAFALSETDSGLLKSLIRWEQWPKIKEEKEKVLRNLLEKLYESSDGYAKRASKILQEDSSSLTLSAPTIIKYWRAMDFEIKSPGAPKYNNP